MAKSYFKENVESIFSCKYNVRDILDNDTDANFIKSSLYSKYRNFIYVCTCSLYGRFVKF